MTAAAQVPILWQHLRYYNQPLFLLFLLASLPADVSDCTFESAYYTTDPNYHTLRGGLVGGPDDADQWVDDRNMDEPSVTVNLLNSAGFSATMAGLVDGDINMAKCQQGNGFVSITANAFATCGVYLSICREVILQQSSSAVHASGCSRPADRDTQPTMTHVVVCRYPRS